MIRDGGTEAGGERGLVHLQGGAVHHRWLRPHCPQVLLYLARGHYDSNDLKSAKQCLLKAVHIAPTDYKLRFNAALTMQVSVESPLDTSW